MQYGTSFEAINFDSEFAKLRMQYETRIHYQNNSIK